MFCYKCGTQLNDDAQFCYSCGESIKAPEQTPTENVTGVTQAQPTSPTAINQPTPTNSTTVEKPNVLAKAGFFMGLFTFLAYFTNSLTVTNQIADYIIFSVVTVSCIVAIVVCLMALLKKSNYTKYNKMAIFGLIFSVIAFTFVFLDIASGIIIYFTTINPPN